MREVKEENSEIRKTKENKKKTTIRKRRIAGSVIGILVIAFFCGGYVRVNHKYPKAVLELAEESEPVESDGIQFVVKNARFYTADEVEPMKEILENAIYIEGMRLITLEMEIQNVSQEAKTFEAAYRRIETLGWSGGVSLVLYRYLNQEDPRTVMELGVNEKRSYILPFTVIPDSFQEKDWEEIEEKEYQYVLSLYPVKKVIALKF